VNIWLLQTSEPLPTEQGARKLRTWLLADKLTERGHHVVWWANAFNHLRKTWHFHKDTDVSVSDRLTVKALHGIGYRTNVSFARLVDHRILAWKFRTAALHLPRPDLIVASMPSYDLAWQAVQYAQRRGIPVVVDIRDQWPDNFVDAVPARLQPLARMVLAGEFRMLRELLQGADALISMSDVLLDWALKNAGREATWRDRVFHLGHRREMMAGGHTGNKIDALAGQLAGKFVVAFVGTFATYHNPEALIDCAQRLRGEDIVFVLGGDGELGGRLRQKAAGLDNLLFPGWLNQEEITALLRQSHLGVCSSGKAGNKFFFPNKAFSYWSAGLPIASAFEGEIADVIDAKRVGFSYRSIAELTTGIFDLLRQPGLHAEMSDNARRLFEDRYNAERIYEAYAAHLECVAELRPRPEAAPAAEAGALGGRNRDVVREG
jgi:glycosyltransferase involved in cell wall biosynthesis